MEVIVHRASLSKLGQCALGVIIKCRGKASLERVEQGRPGSDQMVAVHPLKPAQSWTIHIKRSNRDAFLLRGLMIVEKLGDLKDPSHGVLVVEARHIKLKGMAVWGVMRWGRWWLRGSVGW